ncbi:DMT family transporter [uncultured Microbacterium sp.]|uniref:DMT family transporter n=1 Tax=uncultured Microbacterium sp. TaxID=191216 RepID=UPI0025DE0355|nr:DMT family transporter [uncultured Microbacterium sp.]
MPVLPRSFAVRRHDALLLLGAVCWGSTYLVVKQLLPDPDGAPALIATRMLLSAAVLALFAMARRRGRPTPAEWRTGVLLGLPLSIVFALETYGVALTSATNAGVLIALCIVLVPFAEAAVRRTRLRGVIVALCAVAMMGAWLIAGGHTLSAPGLGDLLILGAALARVVHVTASSALQAARPMDPTRLTAIQLGTVGVVFAALCPVRGTPVGAFFAGMTPPRLLALLYLAIVAGAVVFVIQTWGIAATSATHAGLLLGTEPVWAALFGVFVAHDRLTPMSAIGIVVMLVAVFGAQRLSAREASGNRAPRAKRSPPTPSISPERASPSAPAPRP